MKAAFVILALVSCASDRIAPRDVAEVRQRIQDERVAKLDAENLREQLDKALRQIESKDAELDRLRQALDTVNETVRSLQKQLKQEEATMMAAVTGKRPRLIVFTALEWCPPCQQLDAEIHKLGEMSYTVDGVQRFWRDSIGETEDKSIQIVDCSDDESDNAKWATKWAIGKFPTIVRIDDDGDQESRYTGIVAAIDLSLWQAGKWKPPRRQDELSKH